MTRITRRPLTPPRPLSYKQAPWQGYEISDPGIPRAPRGRVNLQLGGKVVLVTGAGQGLGRAEDVTPMGLLLASPLSSWITGQVVSVNGGYAMV